MVLHQGANSLVESKVTSCVALCVNASLRPSLPVARGALPGERLLLPAALLRLPARTMEEDPDHECVGENFPGVPTTDAADADLTQPGECGEDL